VRTECVLIRTCCLVAVVALATPFHAAAQRRDDGAALAPARAGLDAVRLPPVDGLEAPVADHLREARRTFEQVANRGRANETADAYGALARVLHAYEFFDAAETCYRNATRLKPDDARWLHLRGYLYQQTGRFEDAIDVYLAARRSAPDDYVVTVRLAEALLALGRNGDARIEFQSTVDRLPAVSNAGLGEIALREGRYKDALRHFELVLQRVPDATALEYSLAMAYRGLGRFDDARAHLARRGTGGVRVADPVVDGLESLVRGERAFVLQGRRAYEARQYQRAVEAFQKAVDAAPSSAASRVNLALALVQVGNVDAAVEQFERVLTLDTTNAEARAGIGQLIRTLLTASRDDQAVSVFTRVRVFPTDDEDGTVRLSVALAARERYRDAVALLEESQRTFPDRPTTATTLARLLAASPDLSLRDGQRAFDLAMAVYRRAPLPVYGETIAIALAELGRCDEAADWMRKAIASADAARDATESARLKGEAARYAARPCRP